MHTHPWGLEALPVHVTLQKHLSAPSSPWDFGTSASSRPQVTLGQNAATAEGSLQDPAVGVRNGEEA